MIDTLDRLAEARDEVLRTQNPGIAALQSRLGMGHEQASALIAQLQNEHTILCPWPGRGTGIHPDYRRVHVQSVKGDGRLNYIERVAQLALFYFELAEEGQNAHSRLVLAQLPVGISDWGQVQYLFRSRWYGGEGMTLTDAARAFYAWLLDSGAAPSALGGVEAGIRACCLPYERPFVIVNSVEQCLTRSYVRMARYFRRTVREDFDQHSRVAQWFVNDGLAPQNIRAANTYGEHVVPCAVLRHVAAQCYADQWSIMQVAALLRRLHVVIWLRNEFKGTLDNGRGNVRSRMPVSWSVDKGCLYARLHDKNVPFEPAPGYPCTCNPTNASVIIQD